VAPAPADATKVRLELFFGWSPGGTVWWDDVSFGPVDAPKPRSVKVATVYHRPDGNKSARENIEEFCGWIDRAAQSAPDIVVLPEGMTMVGTSFSCADVAEPIPGPTSERMGEMARKHNCYIVACYNERDGKAVYNTAILVDRKGRLVGKYRKLYIPRNEVTDGELPGQDAVVFHTDFGTVGMMICWDVQYPEPAQLMALKGAEIIFLPIWGGSEHLIKARAIEDHVFVVTSGYDVPSMIVDPEGTVLATARASGKGKGEVAVAEIDLNRRYVDHWDGYMRAVLMKERRDDLQ
jgi:predicted amidohydrolase